MWQKLRKQILYKSLPKLWVVYSILYLHHHQELTKLECICGRSSPLFMMKLMVWYFVSNSHKVMTALIVLPLKSHCGDFSTILSICICGWDQKSLLLVVLWSISYENKWNLTEVGLLNVRLDLYGLTEQKIKGDGNCQVSSLWPFLIFSFDIEWLRIVAQRDVQSLWFYKRSR